MNLSQLTSAVSQRTGIASTDGYYAYITDRINEAIHLIETWGGGTWDYLWDEVTDTTDADTAYLTFDAIATAGSHAGGVRRISGVEFQRSGSSMWEPIRRGNFKTLRDYYASMTSSEELGGWCAKGQKLWFFPTPSTTLNLRIDCFVMEPDLVNDTDEPLLPAAYHRILVSQASGLVLRSVQRPGEAAIEEAAAEQGLKQMAAAQSPNAGPGRMARTWG